MRQPKPPVGQAATELIRPHVWEMALDAGEVLSCTEAWVHKWLNKTPNIQRIELSYDF